MFGMHLGQAHENVIAVADIGGGSVAVALLSLHPDCARILAAERRTLPFEERAPEAMIAGLGKLLIEAGNQACAQHAARGGTMPQSVYAIIRSPWTNSKTLEAGTSFKEESRVSGTLIARLAQQALADDTEFDKSTILEAGVVRVELNGYATNQPENKLARDLSVAVLLSVCDPTVRTTMTAALAQIFGSVPLRMRSGTHALLSVLKGRGGLKDYLIVDMATEGTNLIVVRRGVATEHWFVGEGKRSIFKRIAGSGLIDESIALLHARNRGECSDKACDAMNVAIAKAEPELVRVFGEAMNKLISKERLPNDLILASHADLIPLLRGLFSRIDFTQFTMTTEPFVVDALEPTDFAHWTLPESGVRIDAGICIAAAVVNIEENRG